MKNIKYGLSVDKFIQKSRKYLFQNISIYKKIGNLYYLYVYPLTYKLIYLKNKSGRTIIFYPQKPHPMEVLYKVFNMLGYKITNDPKSKADFVIAYEDVTKRTSNDYSEFLKHKLYVINKLCNDISKDKVNKIFKEIFKYELKINPQTYNQKYLKKSNLNAKHDGTILDYPEKPEKGYVYQKIINNYVGDLVLDYRVPYVFGEMPFVYLKYRPVNDRFSNTNSFVNIEHTNKIFSDSELKKINKFCVLMGLEFGELDILRDNLSQKIYILDVNNTPSGPPNHIKRADYWRALDLIKLAIVKNFLRK